MASINLSRVIDAIITLLSLRVTALEGEAFLYLDTPNGYGSVNTMFGRFSNVRADTGNGVYWTYADSATAGMSITILKRGKYTPRCCVTSNGVAMNIGISINPSSGTTGIQSTTFAAGKRAVAFLTVGRGGQIDAGLNLEVGDVIRFHCDAAALPVNDNSYFTLRKD